MDQLLVTELTVGALELFPILLFEVGAFVDLAALEPLEPVDIFVLPWKRRSAL